MYKTMMCFVVVAVPLLSLAAQRTPEPERFDYLVREDFFAGLRGDEAAFTRAMHLCEATLAKDPAHVEAMVWHGSGLLFLAGKAFTRGDLPQGEDLWRRGLEEMDNAVRRAPDNVSVLIPRGTTLLEVSRHLEGGQAKAMVKQAVDDYEKVLALQAPYFARIPAHARGELLWGLAEGWHRLGDATKARDYLKRIVSEAGASGRSTQAAAWLDKNAAPEHRSAPGCVGCH